MSRVKVPPPKKTRSAGQSESITRKDELYSDLVSDFTSRGCLFARDQAASEGAYIIQAAWQMFAAVLHKSTLSLPKDGGVPSNLCKLCFSGLALKDKPFQFPGTQVL
ncbi:uncharacterized protein LOC144921508 [Branchiostoma floridae x Branchiostoma belcheri]